MYPPGIQGLNATKSGLFFPVDPNTCDHSTTFTLRQLGKSLPVIIFFMIPHIPLVSTLLCSVGFIISCTHFPVLFLSKVHCSCHSSHKIMIPLNENMTYQPGRMALVMLKYIEKEKKKPKPSNQNQPTNHTTQKPCD